MHKNPDPVFFYAEDNQHIDSGVGHERRLGLCFRFHDKLAASTSQQGDHGCPLDTARNLSDSLAGSATWHRRGHSSRYPRLEPNDVARSAAANPVLRDRLGCRLDPGGRPDRVTAAHQHQID